MNVIAGCLLTVYLCLFYREPLVITGTGFIFWLLFLLPSVLWRCWLGGRKGIRPVKTEWWGAGVVICLERGVDLDIAQLMPLPLTVSCSSKIQIGFTFLVLAYLGSPGKRAIKRVFVCVLLFLSLFIGIGANHKALTIIWKNRWLACCPYLMCQLTENEHFTAFTLALQRRYSAAT